MRLGLISMLAFPIGLIAALQTRPQQLKFTQAGTGATERDVASKLGDVVSVKDFGAVCNGSTDDTTAFTNAITSLSSSGGVVDARSCTSGTALTSLTISKSGVSILLPAANIALGTNSLTIAAGTHNVSLVGPTTYGSPSTSTVLGCFIAYTGTGTAVVVGDSSADTNNFRLEGCTININAAGSAAIGLQLNRATFYHLVRPRVTGLLTANTQKLIDLEGYTSFTGGVIEHPRLDNGNTGIYFGKNANASTVLHPWIALQNTGTGIAVTGDAAGQPNGNTVIGGDIENCTTAISFDQAADNTVWGLRAENCTNAVTATANATRNLVFSSGQTNGMTVSDSGSNNGFTDTNFAQFNRAAWRLRNTQNSEGSITISSGSNATQLASLYFADQGTNKYVARKNNDNSFSIVNLATSINRVVLLSANTNISSEGSGTIKFNDQGGGTGGVKFYDGAGSPTQVASIDSAGAVGFASTKTRGSCTLGTNCASITVLSGAICTCADTTAAAACRVSVSGTTLTITGTGTDVINYICFGAS